ncbi:MAG TPA: hypothetical protein VFK28_00445 [Sphingomicrobium sp.]|jgi:hypothetical protein|nr:hypothetical protein [Sphingomicrobium sp.]
MKAHTIELIPVGQPVGPLKWQMSMNGGPPQAQGHYPVIHVPDRDTGDITFTIRHPGSIKFAATDAFCAQQGTSKPQTCDKAVFTSAINQKGQLVVHDANPFDAIYTYVINFDRAPQLDPIIKNGGTTQPVEGSSYKVTTAVEVAALLITFGIIAFIIWRVNVSAAQKKKGP